MSGVDLDAVRARVARAFRRQGEILHESIDASLVHRLEDGAPPGAHSLGSGGFDVAEGRGLVVGALESGKAGNEEGASGSDVEHCVPAAVVELNRETSALGVDASGEPREGGNETVVRERELARVGGSARPRDADRAEHDQAHAASRPRLVEAKTPLPDSAVGLREIRSHRRHDDPVPDLERADPPRGEERIQCHRARTSLMGSPPFARQRVCAWTLGESLDQSMSIE